MSMASNMLSLYLQQGAQAYRGMSISPPIEPAIQQLEADHSQDYRISGQRVNQADAFVWGRSAWANPNYRVL